MELLGPVIVSIDFLSRAHPGAGWGPTRKKKDSTRSLAHQMERPKLMRAGTPLVGPPTTPHSVYKGVYTFVYVML